jgi:hypothetical protein
VGAAYTYRKSSNLQYTPFRSGACDVGQACSIIQPNQYVRGTDVTARGYTIQRYTPPPALVNAGGSGRYRTNYDGYSRRFSGLEATARKRMSHGWMANLALSWNDWTEDYADSNRVNFFGNPTPLDTGALIDGGPVSLLSGGSGKASFYSSYTWQVYADALVTLPANISLSTAIFGRQGGVYPKNITLSPLGLDGSTRVLSGEVDAERYEDLWNIDLRLARNSKIGRVSITPSLELFNVFNSSLVLARARNAGAASLGRAEEVISPRILRVGARLTF